ncbi:MAG: hypothetical protein QMC93_02705 [Patescibacteria group bacterium]|nr:hypothetical protein [Patescibacteria group bacterium]
MPTTLGSYSPQPTEFRDIGQRAKDVLESLISPQLQEQLFPLKIVFIIISFLFLFIFVYLLFKTEYAQRLFLYDLKNFLRPRIFKPEKLIRRWGKIKKEAKKGSEAQWKFALLEGATLLDEILRKAGCRGENLPERLKNLTTEDVSNLNQVLESVQVCQDITRDPDYRLSKERTQEIIDVFEKALRDLEVL